MKNHNSNKLKSTHSIIKKTVYVEGMDCVSCETVLHDALEAVPTIKVLSLTHKTGKMTFEYKNSADLEKLETILKEHNYTLREE
jgi:copper chaperone CopZ